ncbi:uncharacterized protein LOC119831132 [Zerene cesonia]|uniref:uncharacterized protein LOC119831132 n=1 Tax=Zerene cesonia TaxID=33412 RepID=UPI0018E506D7|nr:uncharacterized protein LOC119831132 [Zerene cesonia]
MLKKFINSLEDPEKPLFGPNFWILKKVGLILPNNYKGKIFYIFMHELVTLFVITQYIELYIVRSDFELVLTNLKISMLSIVCVVKSNTFILWQDKWKQVIKYVTEADHWERQMKDAVKGRIIDKYTSYCRKLLNFYWVLLVITVTTVCGSPLFRYLSSSSYREALHNGTELFPHIFSSWTPFDKYHSPGSWITMILHTYFCLEGAGIMASYDTCVLVIMIFFGGKLDLLKERCKEIFKDVYTEEEVIAKVKELHEIHVSLMKYSRTFDSLLSPVMFFYVVICSLMLCVSAFELTSAPDTTQLLLTAEYLIFGIAQLFMYCWHSNDVLVKSGDVASGPYESKWWKASVTERKYVLTLAVLFIFLISDKKCAMENQNSPERTVPIQYVRASRAFRQFKNPPQPHMCIQDTIKDSTEKLFINVLGWQKIANPKQYTDPIPLYGGMQIHQGCGPNSNRPPLLVFAVMVNPDILKANGKNASNPTDREALVSLLCDFVEAMNPGLVLARNPVILKDRDLAGELKDVWLAVQTKREREKGMSQDVMYKVYDIDGIGSDEVNEEDRNGKQYDGNSPNKNQNFDKKNVKSSKQILMNAGQKSEFDSGMNNCQLNQNSTTKDNRCANTDADTTYCTPKYGQMVSSRENHNQINDIQQKFAGNETKPSSSFRKDWNSVHGKTAQSWDEFSKRNVSQMKTEDGKKHKKDKKEMSNGKAHYDFFPVFGNRNNQEVAEDSIKQDISNEDNSKIIVDPMQKLVLHSTDNKICDNKSSALSSLSS